MPDRKTYFKYIFYVLAILLFVTACKRGPETDAIKDYNSQSKWAKAAKKMPVLKAGDERNRGLWNDPSILKDDGKYVLYAATSIEKDFKPPIVPFRFESKDGINWTLNPKTPLLNAKETPFANNETPNVIKYKGTYHMYYSGVYPQGKVPAMAIGHAVSNDGIHWVNDKKPVLEATGNHLDWNGYLVAEPGAVVFNNKIFLYYTAMGSRVSGGPPQLQSIGLAISSNGRDFDKQRQVLTQSDIYPPENGFVGYSTPWAVVHNGKVHLIYDVASYGENNDPQWQQVALHHAVSKDGMTNFVEDKQPMLTRKDFFWTSGEIIGPTMLIDGDKVKLWWAGHVNYSMLGDFIRKGLKGPEVGIGYAEITLDDFLNRE